MTQGKLEGLILLRNVARAADLVERIERFCHDDNAADEYHVADLSAAGQTVLRHAVGDYLALWCAEAPVTLAEEAEIRQRRIDQASVTAGKAGPTIRAIVIDGDFDLRQQNRAEFDAAELILSLRDSDNGREIVVEKDRGGALRGRRFVEVPA